eukprot:SAG31_NODE_33889_length_339_cov_0.645833_1_plen_22_part_10
MPTNANTIHIGHCGHHEPRIAM